MGMLKMGTIVVGLWLAVVPAAGGVPPTCGIVKDFDFRDTNPFAFQTFPANPPPRDRRRLDLGANKNFVRKLQLFALRAIMDRKVDTDRDSDDGGEVERGGTLLPRGNKDDRDWQLWIDKRECKCAKDRRKSIENAIYMYCGGHSDFHCCPQLNKHGADSLEKCWFLRRKDECDLDSDSNRQPGI